MRHVNVLQLLLLLLLGSGGLGGEERLARNEDAAEGQQRCPDGRPDDHPGNGFGADPGS